MNRSRWDFGNISGSPRTGSGHVVYGLGKAIQSLDAPLGRGEQPLGCLLGESGDGEGIILGHLKGCFLSVFALKFREEASITIPDTVALAEVVEVPRDTRRG